MEKEISSSRVRVDMQCNQGAGSRQELVIIQEILQGQPRLSQQRDCRVMFQAPTVNAKNSAGTEKNERCRTPDTGRLMVNNMLMSDHQTGEQRVAQTQPGPCTREVEDPTYNPA